jgi:SAM-dependent methyltransferase
MDKKFHMSDAGNPESEMTSVNTKRPTKQNTPALDIVCNIMLHKRRWRYLRYIHQREGLKLAINTKSVLVVGAGYGLAEIALAIENPQIQFHLTDYFGATHGFDLARKLIDRFKLPNVSFGELDILNPDMEPQSWDMVMSVEVLEHLLDDWRAALNMAALARKNVFTLVPFATQQENANPRRRARALKVTEHVRVGYDASMLAMLFPGPAVVRGCYWHGAGTIFRQRLADLTDEQISTAREELLEQARKDVRNAIPVGGDALGIWQLWMAPNPARDRVEADV